ncbi:tripartite tricarboxylate transporter substrate binding protein [Roseomonas terrae]|jgi:tripartite-type tricarboxylate transporter receptor subunit TctC|uniref:Tripartite tricarboxylate transporter substrate binding protein n=1 Tax=Neoroseomonas terrae TaxID=424799 RepID=A0ABS5EH62_9PROT|nr:tripartite tricarboxylate transporter substrate-binding protein [Neoroseomonas terrae]MBR0650342.1 tripartite tricarboxylate transporter substrate binding protein [Neoroseomonas terrae]
MTQAVSAAPTRRLVLAAGLGGSLGLPAIARGQNAWPNRPVKIIVPFATGGGTDVTMRLLAPKLGEVLGQNVIVENRPGAGSTLGTDFVAKSAPDGYTFALATLSSTGIAATLYPNLPYDPVRDLTAVAPTVFIPTSLAVTTRGWDVRTLDAFVAALKARPGAYSYGSSGIGTTGHIASANFLGHVGARAEHVPYRGAGASFTALIAGETQFTHDIPSLLKPFHEAGQAKVLFVNQAERSTLLPDVPTATEVGLPDYKAYSWYGIFGPANLPAPIVTRMAAAIEQAMSDPALSARFNEMGTPPMLGWNPQRFSRYVADEVVAWAPLVRASGARVE